MSQLAKMPYNPRYISHHVTECSYPIQTSETSRLITDIKSRFERQGIYLVERFAEWEYYNMDAVIALALDTMTRVMKSV